MRRIILFFTAVLLLPAIVSAQSASVTGTVIDSVTRQPVAFVSVTIKENKRGGLTDIDGHFALKNVPANGTLVINYVGYQVRQVPVPKKGDMINIAILRSNDVLEDVVVKSGLNPAHRIIRLMQQNKKMNDPALFSSYSYNAYSIAALGAGPLLFTDPRMRKSATQQAAKPYKNAADSIERKQMAAASRKLARNYLFVTESYTERIYKHPNQIKETVLGTKVSGIDNPFFAISGARFQSFGFYMDFVTILNKSYTSPVIDGSINLYKFNLRQVVPHEKDTTYVISFTPLKGKTFQGLTGILYINSDGYAIENVTAAPSDEKSLIYTFKLLQKYEKVEGRWFPSQINTYVAQRDVVKDSVYFYWDTRSYMKNVVLNKPFKSSEFSDIALDFAPGAGRQTEETWKTFRADTLQAKEKATYEAYQQMPPNRLKALNRANNLFKVLGRQAIPLGDQLEIPFRYLISGVNRFEGIRLGAGLQTTPGFSKWLSLAANAGYGVKDQAWKYGGHVRFIFNERTNTKLTFSFKQDLLEPGVTPYITDNATIFNNRFFRGLYTSRLDSIRQFKAAFTTKIRPWLQADAWLQADHRNPAGFNYGFDIAGNHVFVNEYNSTEAGIGLRYTRGETYAHLGTAKIMNTPPRTQFIVQVSKGLKNVFDGQLDYTKFALQLNHSFRTTHFGKTSFQIDLGQIWGNVPYAYLFTTKGSISETERKSTFGLFINNSFQTVGIYEFTANRTASLFLQQNLGTLLFKPSNPRFRPEFVLVQNIGYGSIDNTDKHQGVILQAPEKGIFETGLQVKNLIRSNIRFAYLGFGFGIFHRYGYYTLPDDKKNWAFKIGMDLSF